MARQYLRKAEPYDQNPNSNWITMTGREFYHFINSPEGRGRYFIKWDDLVIEASKEQYTDWLCNEKHSVYLRDHEKGWDFLSLYSDLSWNGKSGEEFVPDPAIDVEIEAIALIQQRALVEALRQLDHQSFYLIYSLYLASDRRTENELASEVGISQQALHKRKDKILKQLKFLVVKCEKSLQ